MFTARDTSGGSKQVWASLAEEEETTGLVAADAETKYGTFEETRHLRQGLNERHMRMIGLAGSIGTGLFLNIGRALAAGGPLGVLIGYSIVGLAATSVVLGVGEMGALVPLSGGVVRYTEYFVDSALSFAIGWNLVYACFIQLPAEITAATVLIQYWTKVDSAIWITLIGMTLLVIALLFVRLYGELEYIIAWLRISVVVVVNVVALVTSTVGGPQTEPTGFKFWTKPGPFVQYLGVGGSLGRFLGVWACSRTAFYAYAGMEGMVITAAETRNPRKAIPLAAKGVFFRIIFFYITTLFLLGRVVPSNDPSLLQSTGTASQSPFVIAARLAGLKAVPSIINSVALTTILSCANGNVLHGSRYLYGLAKSGRAPYVFTRVSRFGVPHVAICVYSLSICLAYVTMSSSASAVFTWLQSLASVAALTNWITMTVTYLRFYYGCKRQGIDRNKDLPWAAPLQPYAGWFTLALLLLILVAGNPSTWVPGKFNLQEFVSAYFNILLLLTLYVGCKYHQKTRIIPLSELPLGYFINIAKSEPDFVSR